MLAVQLHVLENCNRRSNMWLQDLPEIVRTQDLVFTLTKIFISLLCKPEDTHIEIEQIHRALQPQSQDPSCLRDVIFRIHHYTLK